MQPMTDSPIPSTAPLGQGAARAASEAPAAGEPNSAEGPATGKRTPGERWRRFPSNKALWVSLALLTIAAACLRFWRLSYQCYWTDESYTINRIRGSFSFMLASLADQGFPPGWYALLRWWTMAAEYLTKSDYTALTPAVTRSLTALLGTLTVPAMYYLGRQFTDRKGALLVALLTAVNPYLIYYSRDIKMYPAVWLALILNIALFFKWQSTHRHLLYFPLFLLTGCIMTALHSSAWFMVGLQLIFLLTRPRIKALDGPLWVAGVGAMSLLPIYWYLNQTNWMDRLVERSGDAGLSFVTSYTDMSWKTIASLPCSHLLGYLYPSFPPDPIVRRWFNLGPNFDPHMATRSWPWMASMEFWVAAIFAAIMVLGLIPWRGFRRSPERRAAVTRYRFWWIAIWLVIPTVCLALTWIPQDSPWHAYVWHNLKPKPIWEPRYLGMLVPAWILWLAAALRRLPTLPVRILAIAFVVAASVFSGLSNQLILRNPPFHKAAAIAAEYYDPNNKKNLAVGQVELLTPGKVIPVTYDLALHQRPFKVGGNFIPYENFDISIGSPEQAIAFLRTVRTKPEVQTIVLTDRDGDIKDPRYPLSDEALAERLGPAWKLVREETYELHYEWRFYIFNTWRTRVWKRVPMGAAALLPQPSTSAAGLPATGSASKR